MEFEVASVEGNERLALARVSTIVAPLGLPDDRLKRLETAVAEATMNAMEHGNRYRQEAPVLIEVSASDAELSVKITDEGTGPPTFDPQTPDLEAKLEGAQTPRGWGLFLIKSMVDEMNVTGDERHHTVELILHLNGRKEASDGRKAL